MARTTITPETPLGAYGDYSVAGVADLPMAVTSGDSGDNGNQFVASGKDLVIFHNTAVGPQVITFTSEPDTYGRSQDIDSYSLGAGEYAIFGPFKLTGWEQTDGKIYFETDDADILVAVIAL